uniref:Uncharacterized protein n=1 Tax=Globodera rostochiensis TaxID=31243 RepID=A0A914IE79_GLORO
MKGRVTSSQQQACGDGASRRAPLGGERAGTRGAVARMRGHLPGHARTSSGARSLAPPTGRRSRVRSVILLARTSPRLCLKAYQGRSRPSERYVFDRFNRKGPGAKCWMPPNTVRHVLAIFTSTQIPYHSTPIGSSSVTVALKITVSFFASYHPFCGSINCSNVIKYLIPHLFSFKLKMWRLSS